MENVRYELRKVNFQGMEVSMTFIMEVSNMELAKVLEKAEKEERLRYLKNEKRPEVLEKLKVARDFGDLSENSDVGMVPAGCLAGAKLVATLLSVTAVK